VLIKWNEFVRTNHGIVVEPQTELLRQKVRTVGIGLIDRIPGDFELSIERIWATNRLGEEALREDDRIEEGQLKSKHGEKIRWNEEKAEKPPGWVWDMYKSNVICVPAAILRSLGFISRPLSHETLKPDAIF
jgi:hypothetical protein